MKGKCNVDLDEEYELLKYRSFIVPDEDESYKVKRRNSDTLGAINTLINLGKLEETTDYKLLVLQGIVAAMRPYILEMKNSNKEPIFVSDHFMVRYYERVLKVTLEGKDDVDKVSRLFKDKTPRQIRDIRKEIIPDDFSRKLLFYGKDFVSEINGYKYIVRNLCLTTILPL